MTAGLQQAIGSLENEGPVFDESGFCYWTAEAQPISEQPDASSSGACSLLDRPRYSRSDTGQH